MPDTKPSNLFPGPLVSSSDLSRLAEDEVDRMLALAEEARLAEIDAYWALCTTCPDRAASLTSGAAPILTELFRLARQTYAVPPPSAHPGLSAATMRLLASAAVRDELIPATRPCDPVDAFWEEGEIVALKIIQGEQVVAIRYDGPLFNPGTVAESDVTSEEFGYLACYRENIGGAGEFEYLAAYVIATLSDANHFKHIHLDLASRSELVRDIPAMEALVAHGRLSDRLFDTRPFPTYLCANDALVTRLQARKAALRLQGNDHVHPDPDTRPE